MAYISNETKILEQYNASKYENKSEIECIECILSLLNFMPIFHSVFECFGIQKLYYQLFFISVLLALI